MIIEYIILTLFIFSFGAVMFILARKIPVLNNLPHHGTTGIKKHHYILEVEHKIKGVAVFFEKQIYLHKFLSFVKVMTLKIETKVDKSLKNIRMKAQKIDKNLIEKK